MTVTDRAKVMRLLRTVLPVDEAEAIGLALEVAAFHLPGSIAGNALAHATRERLMHGSVDPRVILHKWHADCVTDLLASTPADSPAHARTCSEHEKSITLLSEARIAFPAVGTKLQ